MALWLVTFTAGADERTPAGQLRECVAAARDAGAIAACEAGRQDALKTQIARWAKAIRSRLSGPELALFQRNTRAWQDFFDSEREMLTRILRQRRDGLGDSLYPGAITRLYEERERQLREHLHNLSYVGLAPSEESL